MNKKEKVTVSKTIDKDSKIGNVIGIISLVLFIGLGIIFPIVVGNVNRVSLETNPIFVYIPIISLILGIILMVYGKNRFPNNKIIKTSLVIIATSVIVGIVLFIILVNMCGKSVSDTCSNIDDTKINETLDALE